MGSGIAQTLAMHGFEVCMVDTEVAFLECGIENIRASLARLCCLCPPLLRFLRYPPPRSPRM